MQPTKVVVSLKAIRNNLKHLKKKVGKDIKILACVKTDAYGHGIERVSKTIHKEVDYLAVASVDEGVFLRKIGVKLPILILNCILPEEVKGVIKYNLTQTLCSFEVAYALDKEASKKNKKATVHIDIDTGMGRIGVRLPDAVDFIKKVKKLKKLNIEGIYTHFPSADDDENFTYKQIETFGELIKKLETIGIEIPLKHTANSAAVMNFPKSYFNMVRPGLMIYGYYPSPYVKRTVKLEPALSLITRIVCLRKLPKGATVSYGRTYTTSRPSMIATLPIGYGDGYSRALSNKGEVIIHGKRAPVVGRICMDQTMVDVSKIPGVKIGDEVVLIGKQALNRTCSGSGQKNETITVEEIAAKIGTISYEVVCMIGKKVKREYI
jgi:alanine racemase